MLKSETGQKPFPQLSETCQCLCLNYIVCCNPITVWSIVNLILFLLFFTPPPPPTIIIIAANWYKDNTDNYPLCGNSSGAG